MNNLVPPFPLSSFSSLLSCWCYKDRRRWEEENERGERKGVERGGLEGVGEEKRG